MTAALKLKPPPEIAPPVPLGALGLRLWRDTTAAFADWLPHDLTTLAAACLAWQEVVDLSAMITDEQDHKTLRQLRADRNAAATTYRQAIRELSLAAAPPDSRVPRIVNRY